MKLIEPPTPELFAACSQVLDRELKPLYYKELTRQAIAALGYDESEVQMYRVAEDVRQWLHERTKYDVFYTGEPFCMMAKRKWFHAGQLPLMNVDEPIQIPGSAASGAEGAFVALMRSPYMQDHWNGNTERRNRARSRGLVLEQHVKDWFKENYEEFYREPDNANAWHKPSSEDFKLVIDSKELKVDVAGTNGNGAYGGQKKATDIHLLCEIRDKHVYWVGVIRGSQWSEYIVPETALSPHRLLVWLNCALHDIDYNALRKSLLPAMPTAQTAAP